MNTDINSYRFTSDSEPTDEQLFAIMKEVESDVRRQNLELKNQIVENLRRGFEIANTQYQNLY